MPGGLELWSLLRYIKGLGDPFGTLQQSSDPPDLRALKHTLMTGCLSGGFQYASSAIDSYASVCPSWHTADIFYSWMAEPKSNHGESIGSRCSDWCSNLEAFRNKHIQRHILWEGLPIR